MIKKDVEIKGRWIVFGSNNKKYLCLEIREVVKE